MKTIWNWLLNPTVRLKTTSGLSLGWLAGSYTLVICWLVAGSLLPNSLFFAFVSFYAAYGERLSKAFLPVETRVTVSRYLEAFFANGDLITAGLIVSTFICGFGAAAWSMRRNLKGVSKDSIYQSLSLNFDSFGGKAWPVVWRALMGSALMLSAGPLLKLLPLPAGTDKAAATIMQLNGIYFLATAALVALIAPFFEELVFRGFLYGTLRSKFANGKRFVLSERGAHFLATAIVSLIFAVIHHNNITSTLEIIVMAVVMSELYRRSGSLWCSIVAHTVNNTVTVLMLCLTA